RSFSNERTEGAGRGPGRPDRHGRARPPLPDRVRSLGDGAPRDRARGDAPGRPGRPTILYDGVRDHLEPVLLLYAVNYTAGGTVDTLLYLHALAIGLGAVPFYALGRRRGRSAVEACFMATGYLLLPPLHRLVEKDYLRLDLLLFPVLAVLAYAVTVRRDRLALAAAVLALCVRESGALAVVGLGLHRLCVERRVRSGLALV